MDTKINNLPPVTATQELSAPPRVAVNTRRAETSVAASLDDQVSLTGSAQAMRQAEAEAEVDSAPVDAGRIARLREAIAEGKYRIDVQRIAARLLELELPAGV